jgi:hypothetical protein
MRRRSRAGPEPVKSRRIKTKTQKHRSGLKTTRLRNSSAADHQTQSDVAQLTRERDEALERERATAEVLRVISSSPGELEPVFQAMLANATRLCEANFGSLYLRERGAFRITAMHSAPPAYEALRRSEPVMDSAHPLIKLSSAVSPRRRRSFRSLTLCRHRPRYAGRLPSLPRLAPFSPYRCSKKTN